VEKKKRKKEIKAIVRKQNIRERKEQGMMHNENKQM